MNTPKVSIISLYLLTALFCVFIFIYEKAHLYENAEDLDQHVKIVANALWNMDSVTPVEYFQLAVKHNNYETLTIQELDGKVFLDFTGDELSLLDRFFIKLNLLPIISLKTPITYSDTIIGELHVTYRHATIYTHIYIFFLFVFIYLAIEGYLRTVAANQTLEQKVVRRTKELEKTNRALQESERSILEYTDALNTFNARLSIDGTLEWVNLSAILTSNLSREQLCGMPLKDTPWWNYSEEAQQSVQLAIDDAQKGKRTTFESKIKILDNEFLIVQLTIHPVFDSTGQPHYLIAEAQNITPLKESEQALRDSQKNLQITLDSIGDGVIATNVDGYITRMNPVAEILTGFSLREAVNKPLNEILQITDIYHEAAPANPVDQIINHGRILPHAKPGESLLINKHGNEYIISENGAPIRDHNNDVVGVVLVFRDITEQHQVEEKLRHSQKMDSIGMLAGGVAHDFNNMLAGILGYSQILMMKLEDEKLKQFADNITKTANRAADLTSKLLAFSRKGKIHSTSIDLHAIIRETGELLERSIDKKIELLIDLQAKYHFITGDPAELQNAILNLGVNARDAMPNGGTLSITTRDTVLNEAYCKASHSDIEPGHYLELCVRDVGIGIDPEIQNKIFEPFFTTKEIGKGTGLGLAAVYGTVTQHLGCIDVYSDKGQGTSFHIYLPISETQLATTTTSDEAISETHEGCILIVDDEDIVRSMAYELLTEIGYTVLLAEDGEQGAIIFQKNYDKIDLVILDMVMPKLSGQECFRKIRNTDPKARIVLSSGFAQNSTIETLKQQGVQGFLKKPYTLADLQTVVQKALTSE